MLKKKIEKWKDYYICIISICNQFVMFTKKIINIIWSEI